MGFGMEHGDERFRAEVVKRKYSNELAIEALKIPARHGVPFTVNNIIGFPDETRALAMDTSALNRSFGSVQLSCSIFQPYHGTPLRPLCEQKGYIGSDVLCPAISENTVMNLPTFGADGLRGLKRTFAMYVKIPRSRWKDIELAEAFTPEGDAMFGKLSAEFAETFLGSSETDITEQGNPLPVG